MGNAGDVEPVGEGASELRIPLWSWLSRVFHPAGSKLDRAAVRRRQEHAGKGHRDREGTGGKFGALIMALKTTRFDSADYLDSDEAISAYAEEALETGDPAFI